MEGEKDIFPRPKDKPTSPDEKVEKMVEVVKISTIFNDPKVLEKIADELISAGIISGFSIEPVKAGYIYKGAKIEEEQYQLEILLEAGAGQEIKDKIHSKIEEIIGKKWDVPAVIEEDVRVNEKFLGFIKRAETEHKKFKKERNLKLTVGLAALLSISGMIGILTRKYVNEKREEVASSERARNYKELEDLQQKVQQKVQELDRKIYMKKPLHESPTDMAAFAGYDETWEIINLVRDAEFAAQKLAEPERFKDIKDSK
ncbi:MAG: hypothetical protein ABR875_03305 [Minisyncoccia bacterium]